MLKECHAHIILDGANYKNAIAFHRNGVNEFIIKERLQNYRDKNILFIRDGGDNLGVSYRASQLAEEYDIDYRTPIFAIYKKGCYGSILGNSFETIKEYRNLVQQVKRKNGDFVKVMLSGIMDFEQYGLIKGNGLSAKEIKEMIKIAHGEGLAVMAHVNGAELIKTALEAGADSIEHGYYMDEECVTYLKQTKAIWVPTITPVANLMGIGGFNEIIINRIISKHKENIVLASKSGVLIAPGSDAGAYQVSHGLGLMQELAFLKQILPPEVDAVELLTQSINKIRLRFKQNYPAN